MVGNNDKGIDLERTRLANGSKSIAQAIDGFIRSRNTTAKIRHKCRERWRVDIAWGMWGYAGLTRPTLTSPFRWPFRPSCSSNLMSKPPFQSAYFLNPSAVSSLKCNTGLKVHDFPRKDLCWGFKVEAFARAVV